MKLDDSEQSRARRVGIDAARGLAVVLMVQAHALDGWVRDADRASAAYAVSRALSAIPVPLFLLLAGIGLAFAEAKAADPGALRAKLARRGLTIVLWGYAVSVVYALLEGSLRTTSILRADILQAIGLSIVICALLLIGSRSVVRMGALAAAALAAGPLFAWAGGAELVPSWLAPLAALFVDVPPYTRFPLLPLLAFCVAGLALGRWLARAPAISWRTWIAAALVMAGAAVVLTLATRASVALLGGTLSRAHPAVVLNVADGLARAFAVLALSLALEARAPAWLLRLGRASLFAYAFHIPFAYAGFTRPVHHQLAMWEASGLMVLLIALTLLAVLARDAVLGRISVFRSARSSARAASEEEHQEHEEPRH